MTALFKNRSMGFILLAAGVGALISYQNCGKIASNDLSSGNGTQNLPLQTPTLSRKMYVVDEVSKRTVTFTTNADQVTCSHDGGNSFGPCDSANSVVWTVADYTNGNTIVVKAAQQGQGEKSSSFTPKTLYPGVSFVTCTDEVTTSMSTTEFNALITAPKKVICLSDRIEITHPDEAIDSVKITQNETTIIAREGDSATFINDYASTTTSQRAGISWTGVNNISIVGVKVAVSTAGPGILGVTTLNVFIDGVESNVSGNGGNALSLASTGGTSTTGTVRNSLFVTSGTGSATVNLTIINPAQSVTLDRCTLKNSSPTVASYVVQTVGTANKTIMNSTLESAGAVPSEYVINNASPLVVQDSTLTGSNILYHSAGNPSWAVTINGNQFRKNTVSGDFYAITVAGGGTGTVNSTAPNRFCALGGVTFRSLIFNALSSSSTFTIENQYDRGAVGNCP